MKSRIALLCLICLVANAGLFGDLTKIGDSIVKETNNYVVKPIVSAENFVEKKTVTAANTVGNGISSGASAVAHETVALFDHLTNLETAAEKQEAEKKI